MLNRNFVAITLIALTKATASFGSQLICTDLNTQEKYELNLNQNHFGNEEKGIHSVTVRPSGTIAVVESSGAPSEPPAIFFSYSMEDGTGEGTLWGSPVSLKCK